MHRETSQEIDAVAADWAARIDRGALSPADEGELDAWIAGDARRLGAFMRMRAVALQSNSARALGPDFDPEAFAQAEPPAATPITRRRLFWLGGSAVAASALGAIGLGLMMRDTVYETKLGEMRVVTLEDGSAVTLNTASRIRVAFADARRTVTLEEGEALFDVAKDPARPFIVEAGGTSVRAVGTSFSVKRLSDAPVEVLVREGIVEVAQPATPRPVRMTANMRIVTSHAVAQPVAIAPTEVDREIAWRSGRIAFEGEPLAQAAAAFGRYSDTRIIIEDPGIGREEITGLFASNDPVTFARAAAASLELKAVIGPGEVRLSR
ncbi:FecR family protein [Sphingomonas colocasiae]|uniref:FecR domain-containing protein n=1 Tax=Sphingomonas colocasiae TaxID=1848973 RepID=A0ABS7PV75_9SPHN|nr:FecR domain-containing protein [Sphingomonas colocasiae]MBY8825263.1 FecR domain-containing protein [Sphingomonas colocasiae]